MNGKVDSMAELGVNRSARSLGMLILTPDPSTLRHVRSASAKLKCARALRVERLTKEEAVWLHVSEGTVKVHVKHILEKLAATEHAHAVAIALSRGIIDLRGSNAFVAKHI